MILQKTFIIIYLYWQLHIINKRLKKKRWNIAAYNYQNREWRSDIKVIRVILIIPWFCSFGVLLKNMFLIAFYGWSKLKCITISSSWLTMMTSTKLKEKRDASFFLTESVVNSFENLYIIIMTNKNLFFHLQSTFVYYKRVRKNIEYEKVYINKEIFLSFYSSFLFTTFVFLLFKKNHTN